MIAPECVDGNEHNVGKCWLLLPLKPKNQKNGHESQRQEYDSPFHHSDGPRSKSKV